VPRYRYRVVDAEGKSISAEATAPTSASIVDELRNRGMTVVEMTELVEKKEIQPSVIRKVTFNFGLSRKDLSLFTRQLSTTLTAGVPLLRIFAVLRKRNSNVTLSNILEQLSSDLQKGSRFSEALAKHPRTFDDTFLNMTRVGEASGNLPATMTRLASMLDKEVAVRRKIKGATAYPLFVLAFTAVLSYALLAFLMPLFLPILENSGLDIKHEYPLTQWLMNMSHFVSNPTNVAIGAVSIVLLLILYKLIVRTEQGHYVVDLLKFYFPFLRSLQQQAATARFARSFALLLQSGVPMLQAINLVGGAAGNMVVTRSLQVVAKQVSEGGRLSEMLDKSRVFPDLMIQMAAIGEEAGSLPAMFEHVADYYEAEIDSTITNLTSVLEPAMMVIVGAIVCLFIMGVLLPILGISSAVQKQM
jgi:type IV pilus assembly protein PilC